MESEILKIVLNSVKNITHVYGDPIKVTKYGNSIIITFKNGLKYKIGLMSLFNSEVTLDEYNQKPEFPKDRIEYPS